MFFGISGGEAVLLLVLGLLILGPERLPKVAADAARTLRNVRRMADSARADVTRELGPEFEDIGLADLDPRRFVSRHLLENERDGDPRAENGRGPSGGAARGAARGRAPAAKPAAAPRRASGATASTEPPPYDADAT